jgi:ABC-type glutathione transport system ATPase component
MPEPLLETFGLNIHFGTDPILTDVSFTIPPASIVGLFGESGCGKTTLALSLLKLLPPSYRIEGAVRFAGLDLLSLSESQLQPLRGASIAIVLQDPLLALNPVLRVGDQIDEVRRAHPAKALDLAAIFSLVGLPESRRRAYPHQLSGGERQRILLAQALACRPALIVADEPFTALDAPRVLELSALFRRLKDTLGTSFLLISHSPGVMARVADEVLTMHAGRIVERRPARHMQSVQPRDDGSPDSLAGGLAIEGLSKSFQGRPVLRDVSLTLEPARILAIVGASGSGKTTLARCLARFETPDAGEIRIDGRDLRMLPRTAVQLIFQQPAASLNPRFTAAEIVAEPLAIQNRIPRSDHFGMVHSAMSAVGLDPAASGRSALSFSGGERQRLAIARTLIVEPKLLILDESFASLDLSIQAQIADLLLDLRRRGLACILISHDLTAVSRIADSIAVIDNGEIVEHATAAELLANPRHPASRNLVNANLVLSGGR